MSKTKFYLGSSYLNKDLAAKTIYQLERMGWECTYNWAQQSKQPKSQWRSIAVHEIDGVTAADVVLILLPGRKGTHTELGAALATGKPVILIGGDGEVEPEPDLCECMFYYHPLVSRLNSVEELSAFVRGYEAGAGVS